MILSRRRVLKWGGALAGVSTVGLRSATVFGREPADGRDVGVSKRIAFLNLHTDERLDIEYFRHGAYRPEALTAIEVLLRDFRTGERHVIDPHLLDYLVDVAHSLDAEPAFSVISGYRSARTNAGLRERSSGVAQHSLHMEGRAIDVRMVHVDCAKLAAHALNLQRGGVGYYRASDFVHLDTGPFRTWKG